MVFNELVKNLTPKIKGIAHKLNGHFTFFDDEDLYQEALVHLWVSYNGGSLNDKTSSYILQSCYFHLKNYIRKSQDKADLLSINSYINEDGNSLEDILASPGHRLIDSVDDNLLIETPVCKSLTEKERKILLFALEGMTVRQIGQRLGVSHVMVVKLRKGIKNKFRNFKAQLSSSGYQN